MNPDAAQRLNGDVELLLQDCSQPWPLADSSLDVVFTSNFLEHLPTKPHVEKTVAEIKRCLKPGGTMIALGPNVRLVPGPTGISGITTSISPIAPWRSC